MRRRGIDSRWLTPCQQLFGEIEDGNSWVAHTLAEVLCADIAPQDRDLAFPTVQSMIFHIVENWSPHDWNLDSLSDLLGAAHCYWLMVKETEEGVKYDTESDTWVKTGSRPRPDNRSVKMFHRAKKRCTDVEKDLVTPCYAVRSRLTGIRNEVGDDAFAAALLADWEARSHRKLSLT